MVWASPLLVLPGCFPGADHRCRLACTAVAPSTRVLSHKGKAPAIHASAFVAPSASVIGQVWGARMARVYCEESRIPMLQAEMVKSIGAPLTAIFPEKKRVYAEK